MREKNHERKKRRGIKKASQEFLRRKQNLMQTQTHARVQSRSMRICLYEKSLRLGFLQFADVRGLVCIRCASSL